MSNNLGAQFGERAAAVLTLHGPDGCGKTTIGEQVGSQLDELDGETLLIGSSDFADWLDPKTYEKYIGSTDRLEAGTAANASPADKTALYEDIPVCLLGVADEHARQKGHVVVHSDPYLKRLAWARLEMRDDEFAEYADRFDRYVTSRIGNLYVSHAAIIDVDADTAFDRINERGPVSEYDPDCPEENDKLVDAVSQIEQMAFGAIPAYPRLVGVNVIRVLNPQQPEPARSEQVAVIADEISKFATNGDRR